MYIKQIETQQAKAEKTSQRFEEEIHLSKLWFRKRPLLSGS
jgi:hypothetical protein